MAITLPRWPAAYSTPLSSTRPPSEALRRATSVLPAPRATRCSLTVPPLSRRRATTLPPSVPSYTTLPSIRGGPLPRRVSSGTEVRSKTHLRLPSFVSRPNRWPSLLRTTAVPSDTAGALTTSADTVVLQRSAPLPASRPTTSPFSVPTTRTSPSTLGPPVKANLVPFFHSVLPLMASSAATSPSTPAA